MFPAENLRDWRDHDVVDAKGAKIGELESVYVDTTTDEPSFAAVRTGMLGRRRLVFVPLQQAVVSPRYLKVIYPKGLVRSSPSIDTDGELSASDEPALFEHYELAYQPGSNGERRLARR